MRIEIEVPRVAKSPNKLLGRHWYAKAAEREAWRQHIYALLSHGDQKRIAAVNESGRILYLEIVQYRKRELDASDNLPASVKPLLDALKSIHLIRDDSGKWVKAEVRQEKCPKGRSQFTMIRFEGDEA